MKGRPPTIAALCALCAVLGVLVGRPKPAVSKPANVQAWVPVAFRRAEPPKEDEWWRIGAPMWLVKYIVVGTMSAVGSLLFSAAIWLCIRPSMGLATEDEGPTSIPICFRCLRTLGTTAYNADISTWYGGPLGVVFAVPLVRQCRRCDIRCCYWRQVDGFINSIVGSLFGPPIGFFRYQQDSVTSVTTAYATRIAKYDPIQGGRVGLNAMDRGGRLALGTDSSNYSVMMGVIMASEAAGARKSNHALACKLLPTDPIRWSRAKGLLERYRREQNEYDSMNPETKLVVYAQLSASTAIMGASQTKRFKAVVDNLNEAQRITEEAVGTMQHLVVTARIGQTPEFDLSNLASMVEHVHGLATRVRIQDAAGGPVLNGIPLAIHNRDYGEARSLPPSEPSEAGEEEVPITITAQGSGGGRGRGGKGRGRGEPRNCHVCGQPGHLAASCPTRPALDAAPPGLAVIREAEGHSSDCRSRNSGEACRAWHLTPHISLTEAMCCLDRRFRDVNPVGVGPIDTIMKFLGNDCLSRESTEFSRAFAHSLLSVDSDVFGDRGCVVASLTVADLLIGNTNVLVEMCQEYLLDFTVAGGAAIYEVARYAQAYSNITGVASTTALANFSPRVYTRAGMLELLGVEAHTAIPPCGHACTVAAALATTLLHQGPSMAHLLVNATCNMADVPEYAIGIESLAHIIFVHEGAEWDGIRAKLDMFPERVEAAIMLTARIEQWAAVLNPLMSPHLNRGEYGRYSAASDVSVSGHACPGICMMTMTALRMYDAIGQAVFFTPGTLPGPFTYAEWGELYTAVSFWFATWWTGPRLLHLLRQPTLVCGLVARMRDYVESANIDRRRGGGFRVPTCGVTVVDLTGRAPVAISDATCGDISGHMADGTWVRQLIGQHNAARVETSLDVRPTRQPTIVIDKTNEGRHAVVLAGNARPRLHARYRFRADRGFEPLGTA